MPATSLWPDFPLQAKPRGMRQLLQEAGADIKEKTNGVIEFGVEAYRLSDQSDSLNHDCNLVVPKANYAYRLFSVRSGLTPPFPARVITPDRNELVKSEDDLTQLLAE